MTPKCRALFSCFAIRVECELLEDHQGLHQTEIDHPNFNRIELRWWPLTRETDPDHPSRRLSEARS